MASTKQKQNTDEFGRGLGGGEYGSVCQIGRRGLYLCAHGDRDLSSFLSIVPSAVLSQPLSEAQRVPFQPSHGRGVAAVVAVPPQEPAPHLDLEQVASAELLAGR